MPDWLQAALSGLAAGGTLFVGALIAWFFRVPLSAVAAVMAFGAGVLISALAFELVEDANDRGGLLPTLGGFVVGAVLYVVADSLLSPMGAGGRMRADRGPADRSRSSGLSIAAGAVIDGIPESLVLGLSVATGGTVNVAIFAAAAISNIPEGLSSTAGLKSEGRTLGNVTGMWGGILAMLSNTMIPEAFARERMLTGLFATAGFLTAFTLHELG